MAHRLRGYGDVHPDLPAVLDPHIAELVQLLEQLADTSSQLPSADG